MDSAKNEEHNASEAQLEASLRIQSLERDVEKLSAQLAVCEALLDSTYRSRVWRRLQPLLWLRQTAGEPGAAAAGFTGLDGAGVRVPLAGLRPSVGASVGWFDSCAIGAVALPGATLEPPTALCFRFVVPAGTVLRAFAGLRQAAWGVNRGGVRFSLRALNANGELCAEVTRELHPATRAADRGWTAMSLDLGAGGYRELQLSTEVPPGGSGDFAWSVFGDPVLLIPGSGAGLSRAGVRVSALGAGMRRRAPTQAKRAQGPSVAFLMPVHDPDPLYLSETLDSVLAQTDDQWTLCITDDGSTDPAVRELLQRVAAREARVSLTRHEHARGISAATNSALALAHADFVATLDHDDRLAPTAVAQVRAALGAQPETDVLYSDNDKLGPGGVRFSPALKGEFAPESLRACMYTLHLGVYRRELVERIGGWRSAFDGAQDHDLMLRLSEATTNIAHLGETLYSWRAHRGSVALDGEAKEAAYKSGVAAIAEHLDRTGIAADVVALEVGGRYRVVYRDPAEMLVSVVVALPRGTELEQANAWIEELVRGLARSPHPVELVVVGEMSAEGVVSVADTAGTWGERVLAGCSAASGEVLVLVQELCAPLADDWLTELIGPLAIEGVVASTPVVLNREGKVVAGAAALLGGMPFVVHQGAQITGDDVADELTMVSDHCCASGVVAVRKECLELDAGQLSRFDQLALLDLTLRLSEGGGRVVFSPHVPWQRLKGIEDEPVDLAQLRALGQRNHGRDDPFYSPRLWQDSAAYVIPRALHHTLRLGEHGIA